MEILTRNPNERTGGQRWENSSVGCEAIIESSAKYPSQKDPDYEPGHLYHILILKKNGEVCSLHWFEEKYLELVCCNENKGLAVLEQHKSALRGSV